MKSDDGNNVVHFPTGLPNYREVGDVKIYGQNENVTGWLAETLGEITDDVPIRCPYCGGEGCKCCCNAA